MGRMSHRNQERTERRISAAASLMLCALTVLAQKHKITATFRPLKAEEAAVVFGTLGNTWVTVTFESPFTGGEYSCRMYSDDLPATFLMEKDGVGYYQGIEAPLIEE